MTPENGEANREGRQAEQHPNVAENIAKGFQAGARRRENLLCTGTTIIIEK